LYCATILIEGWHTIVHNEKGRTVAERIHSSCDSYCEEILAGFSPEKRSETVSIFCTITEKMETMKNRSGCQ
jgi:DNA-binding MarR family transcriptional regulator